MAQISPNSTPAFSTSNVFGSPGSTLAAVAVAASALSGTFSSGVPTGASGWIGWSFTALATLGALFGR